MPKLPAFQFYPGDWRKDPGIQALSFHDRGVWWEVLCLMHESEQRGKLILNGVAMPDDALSRVLGLDNQILTKTLTTLETYGVSSRCETTGALMSRRMVRDEELRQVRKSCGKLGGNPNLVNQKPTTQVKQKPTPSSSSSSSSSSSDKKNTRAALLALPWFQDVKFMKAWEAWEKARKLRGGETQYRSLEKLAGMDSGRAIAILDHSADNQYRGLFAPKGNSNGTGKTGRTDRLNEDARTILRNGSPGPTPGARRADVPAYGALGPSTGPGT